MKQKTEQKLILIQDNPYKNGEREREKEKEKGTSTEFILKIIAQISLYCV